MTWQEFEKRFHEHFTDDPDGRLHLGITTDIGKLTNPTLEYQETIVSRARQMLGLLEDIAHDEELTPDQKLDQELADLALRRQCFKLSLESNGQSALAQMPRAGDEIGDGVFLMFIKDPRPAADRIRDIIGRLNDVPRYANELIARTNQPLARWVKMDVAKVEGLDTLFASVVDWCKEQSPNQSSELEKAVALAHERLSKYREELEAMKTSDTFAIGSEDTARFLDLKGIPFTITKVAAIAAEFLDNTRKTIEDLREKLCTKYDLDPNTPAAEVHRFLKKRFAVKGDGSPASIVARYEQEAAKILAFNKEHDLFPIPDNQAIRIMQTPSFMEPSIPAGAMLPPSPFQPGTRESLVYLTLKPELLAEHTELDIPNMMIHEGIPGHHLQLTYCGLHPSTIRKHIHSNDLAEGWTTMLEDYMLDVGYMGDLEDEARFCAKRDISRIGARVAIDLFFMTGDEQYLDVGIKYQAKGDSPFDKAGALLQEVTGFVDGRVQAELNWYSQERGYPLSYLMGNYQVWQLRRKAEQQWGDKPGFDKAFHTAFLESGEMPASFMPKAFQLRGMLRSE